MRRHPQAVHGPVRRADARDSRRASRGARPRGRLLPGRGLLARRVPGSVHADVREGSGGASGGGQPHTDPAGPRRGRGAGRTGRDDPGRVGRTSPGPGAPVTRGAGIRWPGRRARRSERVRQIMTSGIVVGALLVAGVALAQSRGPTLDSAPHGVVPVTGPSAAALTEPAKPELIPLVTQGDTTRGQGARTAAPSATSTTTARSAPHAVKVAHKPAAKAATRKVAVKKASTPKRVLKGAGASKSRHVAAAKQQPPGHHHHAAVS